MLKELRSRSFTNGKVYALETEDGYPVEVTDTFLPNYTKEAINNNENTLRTYQVGDRTNRWMIGVSCMSGCPVHCKFCLDENTKILMSDFTEKKIRDIKIGDKIVGNLLLKKATLNSQDYATEYNSLATVKHVFKRKYEGVTVLIYTENGDVIKATENHPIAVMKNENERHRIKFAEANDLEIGDSIYRIALDAKEIKDFDAFDFGWLYGFIKGDGVISKNHNRQSFRCSLSQSNDLIYSCDELCEKFDISRGNININKTTSNDAHKTNFRFTINQSGIDKISILLKKYQNMIDFKRGFIAGFYDSEGYSFKNNRETRFCNYNYDLLMQLKSYIEEFGYSAVIKLYSSCIQKNNNQNCYTLETNISRTQFCRFFYPKHEKALFLNKEIRIKHLIQKTKIVKIEKKRETITVYNLETSTNTYYANNILVHNCATGKLKRWRCLTAEEIVAQVEFVIKQNPKYRFDDAWEHKINYTRMGEPFLNIEEVKKAIQIIDEKYPRTHHYISTVGLQGSDFSWIKDNITLQVSLHSLDEERRHNLIPISNLMSIEELGQIRTNSNLKTTVNMTLVDYEDFDINILTKYFDPRYFFIKLSPINENEISEKNHMGSGIIEKRNLM